MASKRKSLSPEQTPTPPTPKRTNPPTNELVVNTPKGGESRHYTLSEWIKTIKEKYKEISELLNNKVPFFSRDDSRYSDDENYFYYSELNQKIISELNSVIQFYKNEYKKKENQYPDLAKNLPYLLEDIDKKDLITQFEVWQKVYLALDLEIQEAVNPPPASPGDPINRVPEGTRVPETPKKNIPPNPTTILDFYQPQSKV